MVNVRSRYWTTSCIMACVAVCAMAHFSAMNRDELHTRSSAFAQLLTSPQQRRVRIVVEAEEFKIRSGKWRIMRYGENYFCATFANTFLSRMACLSAPAQCKRAVAERRIEVPVAGKYQVWARYEIPFNYNVIFAVEIEQNGRLIFQRIYGDRTKPRVWAFRQGIKPMVRYPWGGGDNIVWEGHDAFVNLNEGRALVRLIADLQREPAAERHVDVLIITNDFEGVQEQLKRARYLPLDGWLTQSGRVFARVRNVGRAHVRMESQSCYQHSPYWVHIRDWAKKLSIPEGDAWLAPNRESGWVDVGRQIDSLNDSTWTCEFKVRDGESTRVRFEIAVRTRTNKLCILRRFTVIAPTQLHLVMPADINTKSKIITVQEDLERLCRMVERFPKFGRIPRKILIFGIGGFVGGQRKWEGVESLLARYSALMWSNTVDELPPNVAHYPLPQRRLLADCRGVPTEKLRNWVAKMGDRAKRMAVISLGDEIRIAPLKPTDELNRAFRNYLAQRNVRIGDMTTDRNNPLYYWSQMFGFDEALKYYRERTAILEDAFGMGNVWVGANYSPHPYYYPAPRQWMRTFHKRAMTLPWSEDYVWGVPELSVQVVGYLMTALRCAARPHNLPIMFYVMPHEPGNTPRDFRLSYFTALGNGAKMLHFFCAVPLSVSYTENYISMREPQMYRAVYDVVRETGIAEDYIFDGHVRRGKVALLASAATEILGDGATWNLEAKCTYHALRHAQIAVEFITEDEIVAGELKHYRVLYITGSHLLSSTVPKIERWVRSGGILFCSAGGGLRDEYDRPNERMASLLGIEPSDLEGGLPFVVHIKQDLPWLEPLDEVHCDALGVSFPALIYKRKVKPIASDVKVLGRFKDGSVAITMRRVGKGCVYFVGALPAVAYVRTAIPKRPWERGTTDESFNHYLPTEFDRRLREFVCLPVRHANVEPFVECSAELVEAILIEGNGRAAVTLLNFSGEPVHRMRVRIRNVGQISTIRTLHQKRIPFRQMGDDVLAEVDVNVADMLLIERNCSAGQ